MGKDDFRRVAAVQVTEQGCPVAKVSKRLRVSPHTPSDFFMRIPLQNQAA